MSTLYIRLPSKAAADSVPHWLALACPSVLVAQGGAIEREGATPLSDLSGMIAAAQRVVLLLAASDVTLLRVKVPPLSAARLRAALPNLVEDQLIADPADCVVVAGGVLDGLRTVAVVRRAWLDLLAKTLIGFGARHIAALPAQLCLSCQSDQPGMVTAAICERDMDLTLRLSEQDGIGLAIKPVLSHPEVSKGEGVDQHESAAHEVIQTLCAVVSETPIALYVPQSAVRAYQNVVSQTSALNERINVLADNWSHWIVDANGTTLDLMAGLGAGSGPRLDWRPWRWSLTLVATALSINAAALNIDWWRMKGEASVLRATMVQIYKSAYPKESVIIDPIAQMQQKIAAAKRDSGLAAPDDFTAITAAFGEAWSSAVAAADKTTAIAALEYRERSLFVRLKPGGEAPTQRMQTALAERNLSLDLAALDLASGQSGAVVWQIRGAK